MKLILGNITFEGKIGEPVRAIVHSIAGIIDCSDSDAIGKTPEQVATELGEDLCNLFLAYIIPDVYKGEIIYEVDMVMRVDDEVEEWEDEEDVVTREDVEEWFYSHDNEWQNDTEEDFYSAKEEETSGYSDHLEWAWDCHHRPAEK